MSVFIDTSAFLAIANSADLKHEAAVDIWQRLIDGKDLIVTSNYVVLETTALFQSRHGVPAARSFSEDLLPVVLVEWVDREAHDAALLVVLASSGKGGPSLVDCVSLEIIRRKNMADVFAYDRHFEGRGFKLIG